jgi:RNA polymerase sigma factor (sigma-70 family)
MMIPTETHEGAATEDKATVPASGPRRKRVHLTAEQQDLAARHMPLARSLAKRLKDMWPRYYEDFESAACLALVEAAQSFEPERGVNFATFARFRILGALRDVQRIVMKRGRERELPNAPKTDFWYLPGIEERGCLMLTSPAKPVHEVIGAAEEVEHWVSKLPKRHAEACREIYLHDRTQVDVARKMGCSKSRLSYLHAEAIEMLEHMGEVRLAALEMGLSGCFN